MSVTETSVVGPKGRVVVPQRFRERLDIHEGDELVFSLTAKGALMVLTRRQLIESLDGAWSAALTDSRTSLVDELFADRRTDAARDQR